MKTSALCILLFPSISLASTDDQSLMQQGVGIESGVLAESLSNQWKADVKTVQDAIQEIPHPGKMRQMAIDALMKSVSTSNSLNANSAQLLAQTRALMHDILNSWQATIAQETSDLATIQTAIHACNDASVTTIAGLLTDSDNAKTTHSDCRTAELALRVTANADCTALQAFFDSYATGETPAAGCTAADTVTFPNSHTHPNVEDIWVQDGGATKQVTATDQIHVEGSTSAWSTYVTTNRAHWGAENTAAQGHSSTCVAAVGLWKTQRTTCRANQHSYETDFCTYKNQNDNMCTTRTTCFDAQEILWIAKKALIDAHDLQRIAIAEVIQRCICLIGVVLAGTPPQDTLTNPLTCPLTDNASAISDAMTDVHETMQTVNACPGPDEPYPANGTTWDNFEYATTVTAWQGHTNWNSATFDNELHFDLSAGAGC